MRTCFVLAFQNYIFPLIQKGEYSLFIFHQNKKFLDFSISAGPQRNLQFWSPPLMFQAFSQKLLVENIYPTQVKLVSASYVIQRFHSYKYIWKNHWCYEDILDLQKISHSCSFSDNHTSCILLQVSKINIKTLSSLIPFFYTQVRIKNRTC